MFEAKVRKVGTSLGLLIPTESVSKNKLKEGTKVKVAIIKKDFKLIDKMFGSVKARPFKRDHDDRVI